ncbi:MAG: helix-turn-helix transcriptional regulator [Bacteroidota bacterium]
MPAEARIFVLPEHFSFSMEGGVKTHWYESASDLARSQIRLQHHTISFLQQGTKELVGPQSSVSLQNDHFVLMRAGHCLMTERISAAQQRYQSQLLFFSNAMLLDFLGKHQIQPGSLSSASPFRVCAYDPYVRHFVDSLRQLSGMEERWQRKVMPAKLEEILLYLLEREGGAFLGGLLHDLAPGTRHLVQVVEYNRLHKLSLQELAFLCHMSLSTFKREFQKHYQTSPSKWFQAQRLEHAALRMRTHSLRPVEVFEDAGYENLSTFIQAFKKHFGQTPRQFQDEQLSF